MSSSPNQARPSSARLAAEVHPLRRCATDPTTPARFRRGRGSRPGPRPTARRRGPPPGASTRAANGSAIAVAHDRRGGHVLGDRDHPLAAHLTELLRRLGHRHRRHRDQHDGDHQQLEHQELAGQAAADSARRRTGSTSTVHNDQYFLCVLMSDVGHLMGSSIAEHHTRVIGDDLSKHAGDVRAHARAGCASRRVANGLRGDARRGSRADCTGCG